MKERPILFNGEMVRAILDGRKTMTRRMVKPQPRVVHSIHSDASITTNRIFRKGDQRIHSPFGTIGDQLWVRETFSCMERKPVAGCEVAYRADGESLVLEPWTPSIHMPRWASRINLEITGVRVERVQEITEGDAKKEGMESLRDRCESLADFDESMTDRDLFKALWQSIYSNWDANPWVWVYEFRRVKP